MAWFHWGKKKEKTEETVDTAQVTAEEAVQENSSAEEHADAARTRSNMRTSSARSGIRILHITAYSRLSTIWTRIWLSRTISKASPK